MMSIMSIDEWSPHFPDEETYVVQFYVASLQSSVTVVAFDGSPLRPIGALWALVDQLK
jgi:hypothetical protein